MILAEALIRRKEFKTRIADLQRRLQSVLVVQEGDTPFENPQELLTLLGDMLGEYQALIAAIHRTNLIARLPDGRSLTEAIVARDILDERMAILRGLADQAGRVSERIAHSELRYVPQVDVAELRRTVAAWQGAHRKWRSGPGRRPGQRGSPARASVPPAVAGP